MKKIDWDVELDLKHLKTTLGMDFLPGKTPQMMRQELFAYLLAYNRLRTLMWQARTLHAVNPLCLSMQSTCQHLNNFTKQLAIASAKKPLKLHQTLLKVIVHKPVPMRLGRCEPRVRKRRSKAYPVMQKPRSELGRQLTAVLSCLFPSVLTKATIPYLSAIPLNSIDR